MGQKNNHINKLEKTVSSLEKIIENTPKDPNHIRFAVLENKIDMIDKNFKEKEFEI